MSVGSRVKIIKGAHQGEIGTVKSVNTIPMPNLAGLIEGFDMPEPECSLVLYSLELDNGTGITVTLDCIEFINE
jgi:hypothetical protein